MKRVLALVLAVVLAFGMSTVAFAAGEKITGLRLPDGTALTGTEAIDYADLGTLGYSTTTATNDATNTSVTPWQFSNTNAHHNMSFRVILSNEMFQWKDDKEPSKITLSNLTGLTVRASFTKGGQYFNAPTLSTFTGGVRINLGTKKGITVTNDTTEISGKLLIVYKGDRIEIPIEGVVGHTAEAVDEDTEAVWVSKHNWLDVSEFVKSLEVNFDDNDDVQAYVNVFGGRDYYIWMEEDVQSADEELIAKYDSIEAVYHAYFSSNVNVPTTYVVFDIDEKYYVYNADGEYIGLTTDKQLPLSTVYYLSSKEIEGLGEEVEEPGDAPTAETPEDPANPETGGDNAPANANDNPGTGADGLVSLAVAAGLVALAVAGISKK